MVWYGGIQGRVFYRIDVGRWYGRVVYIVYYTGDYVYKSYGLNYGYKNTMPN